MQACFPSKPSKVCFAVLFACQVAGCRSDGGSSGVSQPTPSPQQAKKTSTPADVVAEPPKPALPREPKTAPSLPMANAAGTESPVASAAQVSPGIDIDGFLAEVRRAGGQGLQTLEKTVHKVDRNFNTAPIRRATYFDGKKELPSPFAGAGVFYGQMDDDTDKEAVVQIRHHTKQIDNFERNEAFWIGIFDRHEGGMRFVGALQHHVWHCTWDDSKLGLVLGFTKKDPGPDAALWIRIQDTESCGTNVSIGYKKKIYRLEGGSLKESDARPPKRVEMDRSAPPLE